MTQIPEHREFLTDLEAETLVAAFVDATLPKPAWNHRAHLTAGLWIVTHEGLERARSSMPPAIKRFNAAVGIANTPTSGYPHETITQLYLTIVDRFRRTMPPDAGFAAAANHLVEQWGGRELPLRYYSEALLMAPEARSRWILPDLAPV